MKAPNCESSELILNPNVNFDTKLEYYKKAYDFELNLKACKDIKIVGFTFGDTLAEIEDYLFPDNEEVEEQCPCMKETSYNCGMKSKIGGIMEIEIINSTGVEWYKDCIGKIFKVQSESRKGGRGKYVVRLEKVDRHLMNGYQYGWVKKEHCKII
ncbi:MAG: hypothetical protein E7C49_11530 [Clostridium sp.]|nr:hypothetical protein [Clostridium sp.]